MVGDGPERERIRQLARDKSLDNIVFASVPYEKTGDLYSIACGAVATLRNVPVAKTMRLSKVFPALSCGVPVVYSGEGEAADLLVQHQCGIATAPEDPAALAEALRSLAADPALRQRLGANGRRMVRKTYSWSTIVDTWLRRLEQPRTGGARPGNAGSKQLFSN